MSLCVYCMFVPGMCVSIKAYHNKQSKSPKGIRTFSLLPRLPAALVSLSSFRGVHSNHSRSWSPEWHQPRCQVHTKTYMHVCIYTARLAYMQPQAYTKLLLAQPPALIGLNAAVCSSRAACIKCTHFTYSSFMNTVWRAFLDFTQHNSLLWKDFTISHAAQLTWHIPFLILV